MTPWIITRHVPKPAANPAAGRGSRILPRLNFTRRTEQKRGKLSYIDTLLEQITCIVGNSESIISDLRYQNIHIKGVVIICFFLTFVFTKLRYNCFSKHKVYTYMVFLKFLGKIQWLVHTPKPGKSNVNVSANTWFSRCSLTECWPKPFRSWVSSLWPGSLYCAVLGHICKLRMSYKNYTLI